LEYWSHDHQGMSPGVPSVASAGTTSPATYPGAVTSTSSAPTPTAPSAGGAAPTGRAARVDRLPWGLAVATLLAQRDIIVTGGAVRLTGSGLGCSQWPMCEPGQFTPEFHAEMTFHPVIEFGNRTLTGVLGVIALAL